MFADFISSLSPDPVSVSKTPPPQFKGHFYVAPRWKSCKHLDQKVKDDVRLGGIRSFQGNKPKK